MGTSLKLPRICPWPEPRRAEQIWEQPCWSFLGNTELDGYALENAKISIKSHQSPGSANHKFLKDVCRYGSALRMGTKSDQDFAASAVSYDFSCQAQPSSGFMCIANRNEYSRGHSALWFLAAATAWVIAKGDTSEWGPPIAKSAEAWFRKAYGNFLRLSHKGIVMGPGWRDPDDLNANYDGALSYFQTGVCPKRPQKMWEKRFNDAGLSVLYMLWSMRVLYDLKLLTDQVKPLNPEPTGLQVRVYSTPEFPYINEVQKITPRDEIMRWSYRVDKQGGIWVQKQEHPTTVTRPSEQDVPFMKVGKIGKG